eukprot:1175470-Prorocentrum_minimum.AAC.5
MCAGTSATRSRLSNRVCVDTERQLYAHAEDVLEGQLTSRRSGGPAGCFPEEGDPGRGGLQGSGPRAGQLGGPASRGLVLQEYNT